MEILIEEFNLAGDLSACMDVMRTNVPASFVKDDMDTFESWLRASRCPFLVCRRKGELIGCGGYSVDSGNDVGWLRWGMVRRDQHRRRVGSSILRERLARLGELGVRTVRVDTSQHSQGFFLRHGFGVLATHPDGYWEGHDRVEMIRPGRDLP